MITQLDHLQIALPAGSEDAMRGFYCGTLGCVEVPKPAALAGRGGFWVMAGTLNLHFGVDPAFHPSTKAHPGFRVAQIDTVAAAITAAGHAVTWDTKIAGLRRFFTQDPVGNRIEIIAA